MNFRLEFDASVENALQPFIVIYTDENRRRRQKRFVSQTAAHDFIAKLSEPHASSSIFRLDPPARKP